MKKIEQIDFVIPWVDGGDKKWQEQRSLYVQEDTKLDVVQYRDWGILKYWFRSVEKYAPWVRKIHFVTCGQIPDWLNTEHPKLNCVNHIDFIPHEYLPTFSSHVIELNLHRISDLAEQFVYFNDDIFINTPVAPTDFFVNGYPCESPILSTLTPSVVGDPFAHFLCNDISVINKHYNKREVIRSSLCKWFYPGYGKLLLKNLYAYPHKAFSAFHVFHIAASMRKATYEELWQLEREILHKTCRNKFRGLNDVNQYVISWFNICQGEFIPRRTDFGKFYTIGLRDEELYQDLVTGKHKLVCINDNPGGLENIEEIQEALIRTFEEKLPEKSAFEI